MDSDFHYVLWQNGDADKKAVLNDSLRKFQLVSLRFGHKCTVVIPNFYIKILLVFISQVQLFKN